PGSSKEKILEIVNNLHIQHVEARSRRSPDVRRYVAELRVNWIRVTLPEDYQSILDELRSSYQDLLEKLIERGLIEIEDGDYVRLKDLLRLRAETIAFKEDRFASALVAALIKLHYFMNLLETQGPEPAKKYLEKVLRRKGRTISDRLLLEDRRVLKAWNWLLSLPKGTVHPKLEELASIIDIEGITRGKRGIVFVNYRKTAEIVLNYLKEKTGVRASLFIGQARREELKGMSQEEQRKILQDFSSGKYDLLVATSIGEEGLDIPEVDLVVFYDAVPSVIRYIQRRGRTGRGRPGKVVVLVSGKREEFFYRTTVMKERKMMKALHEVSSLVEMRRKHITLEEFSMNSQQSSNEKRAPEVIIRVDARELGGEVVRKLASFNDVKISVSKLEVGDYVVSDEVVIERRTIDDLVSSLANREIFEQVDKLKATYKRPILLIECETLYEASKSGVRSRSLMELITSLTIGGLPILWSRNPEESAELIRLLAIKEQRKKVLEIHPLVVDDDTVLERVLTEIPGVNVFVARNLLRAFGSLKNVFSASEKELQSVEGVDPITARRIVKFSNKRYGEELEGKRHLYP
ncbi:MAG TPA: DEAD/DEAH box helicase, partial [Candidatus Korarchaeota archaeon]|nr:DEAD/DEAH box helicase [Candidatus Korarchaeota archaeon]